MIELILVVLIIIAVVKVYFKWSFGYWNRKGVQAPPTSFLFGNATNVFLQKTSLGELLKHIYLEWKPKGWKYCGFYFLAKQTLLAFDLELIKSILTKDFLHFTGHGFYMNEEDDPISVHLFALKDQKWRQFRTKLMPSFSLGKIKMMFQTLMDCTDELLVVMDKAVRNKEGVEINDIALRYTIDVIGSCGFGIDCKSLKNPKCEFKNYGIKITGKECLLQYLKNVIAMSIPNLLSFFRIPLNSPDVSNFFINFVRETVNYREKNNIIRKDFMHLLIQLKNNVRIEDEDNVGQLKNKSWSEESLTTEQMAAQVLFFFTASNIKIQETLRKEIIDVLAKYNDDISYDALSKMTYMDKCINETLRKYPPVPFLMRECTQAYNIPDSEVTIDKGTVVFIPVIGIHHDPEFYPNPEIFDPERFSLENKLKQRQYTWLPFGEGPRICIGIRFGFMQIKAALTVLLRNYKFTLNSKTKTPLVMKPSGVILSVKEGIWLNIETIIN